VLTLQNNILAKVKADILSAASALQEADKQIAAGLDVDISWI
jgi:hypothetical protein